MSEGQWMQVTVRMSPDLHRAMDEARGSLSRNLWIIGLIENELEMPEAPDSSQPMALQPSSALRDKLLAIPEGITPLQYTDQPGGLGLIGSLWIYVRGAGHAFSASGCAAYLDCGSCDADLDRLVELGLLVQTQPAPEAAYQVKR